MTIFEYRIEKLQPTRMSRGELEIYLNKMGGEGWELACIDNNYAIFKKEMKEVVYCS